MTTYIAFIRGINVGAHNRLTMDDLRETCRSVGFENVRTYIQSGNVVFETTESDSEALTTAFMDAIADSFGYDVSVMIRTRTELDDVVERQPFEEPFDEHTKLYVAFLDDEPNDQQVRALSSAGNEAEEFVVRDREVYSRIRTDRLKNGRFTDVGTVLKTPATRRTWNVVTSVRELAN